MYKNNKQCAMNSKCLYVSSFYIDHLNKTTSWVDPRIKILQQQQLDHQKAAHDRVTQQQEQQAINQAKHDQQNQQHQQAQQLKLAQQTALQHQPLLGLGQQQHAGQVGGA